MFHVPLVKYIGPNGLLLKGVLVRFAAIRLVRLLCNLHYGDILVLFSLQRLKRRDNIM